MKTSALLLLSTLVAGTTMAAEEVQLRYGNLSGAISVSVNHDIRAGDLGQAHAGRVFSMDLGLEMGAGSQSKIVRVRINKLRGTYEAHGMTQRLSTNHLEGAYFNLSSIYDDLAVEQKYPEESPTVDLGRITPEGYPIAGALVDLLPQLPKEPVAPGSTWTTNRDMHSLAGWNWANGPLESRHTVTAVEIEDDRTIVSIQTQAQGQISIDGELERKIDWQFDATEGRVLALSMTQKSSGMNELPQGQVPIRQVTQVELLAID